MRFTLACALETFENSDGIPLATMRVYVHVCRGICMCTYAYACVCMNISICNCMYACMRVEREGGKDGQSGRQTHTDTLDVGIMVGARAVAKTMTMMMTYTTALVTVRTTKMI